jgi:DNA-binding beta-propeller fold protein YncE
VVLPAALVILAGCGGGGEAGETTARADSAAADTAAEGAPLSAAIALTLDGLQAPDAARFDPELGVYFVANINGEPSAKDGNGFISRVTRDGKMDSLKFIAAGRGGVKLNGPKGLAIKGDTLWVADIDAVRAFDKRTGKPVATVDLAGKAKFLNDAAVGPDGAIYITDSGANLVYRVADGKATVAVELKDKPGPNGIVWDSAGSRFLIVSFGSTSIYSWAPGPSAPAVIAEGPGKMDGIEPVGDGRFVVTSWVDSSLFVLRGDSIVPLLRGLPSPADIAFDAERGRIGVPLLMENRMEFVDLQR